MDYKKLENTYFLRLDPGDEICDCVKKMCEAEGVGLGLVGGFGALDRMTVGVWDPAEKKFLGNEFRGKYEMTALSGNITRMDGKVYLHAHMSAGDETGACVGGHLISADVSATAEMYVTVLQGEVGREFNPELGLNWMTF